MKESICAIIGVAGSCVAAIFGGWNAAMTTLLIFMAIDYISGIVCAGVFHTSNKTDSGKLESKAGWKGLCRKCMTFLFVLIACRLDLLIGASYIKDAVCIAFIVNETISIVENAGLMGLPIPKVITNAIELLKSKSKEAEDNDDELQ